MLDGTPFRTYIVKADVWINKTHHRDSQGPKGLEYTLNLQERVNVPTFLEAKVNPVGVSADADQTECPTGHSPQVTAPAGALCSTHSLCDTSTQQGDEAGEMVSGLVTAQHHPIYPACSVV